MGQKVGNQIRVASSLKYAYPILGIVRQPGWLTMDLIGVLILQSNASLGKLLTWCVHLAIHYANASDRAGQFPHQRLITSRS